MPQLVLDVSSESCIGDAPFGVGLLHRCFEETCIEGARLIGRKDAELDGVASDGVRVVREDMNPDRAANNGVLVVES